MYEVELKVKASHGTVRQRLEAAGGTFLGTVRQADTYYDAPDRDFAETDEAVRVRRERDGDAERVRLTYKGPLVDSAAKTREEAETGVDDGEALAAILSGMGYEPAATVRKERDRYRLDGCTVTLDSVDGLGEFVEVELETEADVDAAREEAAATMESLGLDPDEGIRTSYLGLLLARE